MTRAHPVASAAAAWARALARTTPARVHWDRVALTGGGITAPVALSLVLAPHDDALIGAGALASMGALAASVMDVGVAGIERVHRMVFVSVVATIGFALGTAVHGHAVLTFVAVIVAGFLSGLSGAISATASKSAIYFLMFVVMAANTDFGLASAWTAPLVFFIGAAWRVLLTALAAAYEGRAFAPERAAVARVYTAIVDQLAAEGVADREKAGAALTRALNDAYDVLVAARTELAAHDHRWQSLVAVLNASAPVVDATIAAAEDRVAVSPDVLASLRSVAAWVAEPARPVPRVPPPLPGVGMDRALADAVRHVFRVIDGLAVDAAAGGGAEASLPGKTSTIARLRSARRALMSGTELWGSILRLILCLAVAQGLCIIWQLDRPYLVMLTVAQVMKPDFGSIFGRAVQRGAGTLIGVAVGSLAVAVVPRGEWQILVVLIFAAGIPIVMPRNYGLFSIITTPLAVVLVELHVSDSAGLLDVRLLDTLLGCAIVLALGYLPWPQTWHAPRHLAAEVAVIARSIGSYADLALRRPDDPERISMRREVYRRISDLRTTVAQSLAEPPPISAATASWLPEIAALERVADAVTAVSTDAASSGTPPPEAEADGVCAALSDLADAAVSGHRPAQGDVASIVSGALAGELSAARATLLVQQRGARRRRRATR
mgnify:CR=1 FL=1